MAVSESSLNSIGEIDMDESVIQYFEKPEQKTKLRLSDAIRIGARLRPQCVGRLYRYGGSCVIGAAFVGAGWKSEAEEYEANEGSSPWHLLETTVSVLHDYYARHWSDHYSC